MGIFSNPFKGRQPGNQTPTIEARSYHPKVREVMDILENKPHASDADIAAAIHLSPETAEPFIKRAKEALLREELLSQKNNQTTGPNTGPLNGQVPNTPTVKQVKSVW